MSILRTVGMHTRTVSCLALHAPSHSVLSASLDGSVHMTSLDTFEPVHRAKLQSPILGMSLLDRSSFHIHTGAIRTLRLRFRFPARRA